MFVRLLKTLTFFLLSTPVFAVSLPDLEAIVSPFPTLNAFLADDVAVLKYRVALSAYMDEDESFAPVFAEFIRQIKEVNGKVPSVGAQAWRLNPEWEKQSFSIRGEASGSGLQIKREELMDALEALKRQTEKLAAEAESHGIAQLQAELQNTYGLSTQPETVKPSRTQQAAFEKRLGGDKEKGIPRIGEHPAARLLAAYAANQKFLHDEALGDALHSGDADIIVRALQELKRVGDSSDFYQAHGVTVPKEILKFLRFDEPMAPLLAEYEQGIKSMQEFRKIADPRLDPAVRLKIDTLAAQGIPGEKISEHLTPEENQKWTDWYQAHKAVGTQKVEFAREYNRSVENFRYDLIRDPIRGTYRLKSDTALEVNFIPTPRPFHAFFAGRKTQECVGGRDCDNLTPKRWVRAALQDSESFFTETEPGRMEGMVGLTKLQKLKPSGIGEQVKRLWARLRSPLRAPVTETYHVVDLMSRAVKSDVVVKNERTGKPLKYSIFDKFVDEFAKKWPGRPLVISDGHHISQNVAGGEVVLQSPAFLEDRQVGKPYQFRPVDPMAKKVAELYPGALNNYGGNGLIFDGMPDDGLKIVELVPQSRRRQWTRDELEEEILGRADIRWPVEEIVWQRAQESGVRLERQSVYLRDGKTPGTKYFEKRLLSDKPEVAKVANDLLIHAMKQPDEAAKLIPFIRRLIENPPRSKAAAIGLVALREVNWHLPEPSVHLIPEDLTRLIQPHLRKWGDLLPLLNRVIELRPDFPDLRDFLLRNLTNTPGSEEADGAISGLSMYLNHHRHDPKMREMLPEVISGLVKNLELVPELHLEYIDSSKGEDIPHSAQSLLEELLHIYPKEVFHYAQDLFQNKIEHYPSLKRTALGVLFVRRHRGLLSLLIKNGEFSFLQEHLHRTVSPHIPQEVLELTDTRTARKVVDELDLGGCSRFLQQLYLKYRTP